MCKGNRAKISAWETCKRQFPIRKGGLTVCTELALSPGSGWLPLEGGGLVRKRGVKGVLILYNSLSVMFRKDKSIKKQEKGGENEL